MYWQHDTSELRRFLPAFQPWKWGERGGEKNDGASASCIRYLAASALLSVCFVYFRQTARGRWLLSPLEDAHSALCSDGWQSVGATKALQLCHLLVRFSHIAELVKQVTLGVWRTCSKYSVGLLSFFFFFYQGLSIFITVVRWGSCLFRFLLLSVTQHKQ